ncbi:MAG: DegT/DnrJ/EryC1/StrS family aminotransferase, partial [Deltaproteobacteria bacterium]
MREDVVRQIPAQKFGEQFTAIREEVLERVEKVCRSGRFILGEEVKNFEEDFAGWLGVPHAVGCGSGTDAILLGLLALGIGSGDEVITSPLTFFATGSAIVRAGAKPVFADIDPATYTIDPRR